MAFSLDNESRFPLERSLTTQILACVYLSILITGSVLLAAKILAQLIFN
jgi:hypothetical protein